jgi:hypothetical protein
MRSRSLLWAVMTLVVFLPGCEQGDRPVDDGGGGPVAIGATAPDFSLPAATAGEVSL